MKKGMLFINNDALAGVIEALLLVGLVAIILSFIQLYYIPEIMEDKEATHMDQVSQQFSQLKSVIDIQSTMGVINDENPNPKYVAYTSMSSPLTLGSRQLPYFVSSASPGQVTLIDENDVENYYIIKIISEKSGVYEIPLTSIKYEAYNYYFIPQNFIIEGGGIILNQSDGEVMEVNPAINIENISIGYNNIIEMNYNIPVFVGAPGKKIYGGYDDCYIRTNYTTYEPPLIITNITSLEIYTKYPEAWYHGLNSNGGILREYCDNFYIDVTIDRSTTPNKVKITPRSGDIEIILTIVEIGVQIGPGAIISK